MSRAFATVVQGVYCASLLGVNALALVTHVPWLSWLSGAYRGALVLPAPPLPQQGGEHGPQATGVAWSLTVALSQLHFHSCTFTVALSQLHSLSCIFTVALLFCAHSIFCFDRHITKNAPNSGQNVRQIHFMIFFERLLKKIRSYHM